jgi:hypothetical protein
MASIKPPVVFTGPSLSAAEAAAALPGATILPPAARGDLYRARFFNASFIVFLDGVFHERLAPSPREVVDVARDGALLLGASSLGAIRAAECWPVGVRGAGTIYRLYRSGSLLSDDEVALVFDPASGRALSVPLINVRFAVRRAVRSRILSTAEAGGLLSAAGSLFYPDRIWPEMLHLAGLGGRTGLSEYLAAHDLKRRDGLRALSLAARWLRDDPGLLHRHVRLHSDPFDFADASREPMADALLDQQPGCTPIELAAWLIGSGRYLRFTDALIGQGENEAASRLRLADGQCESSPSSTARVALRRVHARASALEHLLRDTESFAQSLWIELRARGDLQGELFRRRAIRQAAGDRPVVDPLRLHQAELSILAEHGLQSWQDLETWAACRRLPIEWFEESRRMVAAARESRRETAGYAAYPAVQP